MKRKLTILVVICVVCVFSFSSVTFAINSNYIVTGYHWGTVDINITGLTGNYYNALVSAANSWSQSGISRSVPYTASSVNKVYKVSSLPGNVVALYTPLTTNTNYVLQQQYITTKFKIELPIIS
jgi:hypothetical protein